MKIGLILKKILRLIQCGAELIIRFRHRYDSYKCCATCKYKRRGQIAFLPVVCGCANHKRMYTEHKSIILGADREPSTVAFCMYWKPDYKTYMQGHIDFQNSINESIKEHRKELKNKRSVEHDKKELERCD